jgi:23S rRNA (guanosine2251-2'-O)-methyltransferase
MKKLSLQELERISVTDFKTATKNKIVVVLDNIRSMHNVGSIFRTADAFLIEAIVLTGFTPQPPHRDIHKTALGATETVDWLYFDTIEQALEALKTKGYAIYAVEQTTESISLEKLPHFTESIAVVLGNEVEGVNADILPLCNGCIEIPQLGTKHSLNVSVAAGIVLWKLVEPHFAKGLV